jgi:type IV fimbrial biogenesis protein FimT
MTMRAPRTFACRGSRGFTLVEMMVVAALFIIVLAVAVPSFGDMISRQRVRSINAEMITDVHFARSEAVQRSRLIRMRFGSNGTSTCYSIYVTATAGDCFCAKTTPPRCTGLVTELKTVIVPRSSTVALAASSAVSTFIDFDPARGMARQDDVAIDITSNRAGHLTTRVSPLGQVSVCSPDGSISGAKYPC